MVNQLDGIVDISKLLKFESQLNAQKSEVCNL